MATALVHFLACSVAGERRPLRYNVEVAGNLQQSVEYQRPRLCNCFLHRQYANEVIAHAQMIALSLNVGVDGLVIEKLRALRYAGNSPIVVVEQTAEESKLACMIEELDLHEVAELTDEALHSLFERYNVTLDLRANQSLHAAA